MDNKLFTQSPHLQVVATGNNYVAWNSLFGYGRIIDSNGLDFLRAFTRPVGVMESGVIDNYEQPHEIFENMAEAYFLIPTDFNERSFLQKKNEEYAKKISNGQNVEYLSLIASEECNFACSYCISNSMISVSDRKYSIKKIMSMLTAIKAVDIFFQLLTENNKHEAYINFGGGEPLLDWKVIKETIEYCQKKYGEKFNVTFSINTNASLINQNIATFFKHRNVNVAISLDGLQVANDLVRKFKSGKGTFQSITQRLDMFTKISFPLNGFSVTVNEKNFALLDEGLIDFALRKKMREIRVDLDVIHMHSIDVNDVVRKIIELKNYANKVGVQVSGFWARPLENLNSSILEKHIAFCGGVAGKSMCVSPSENTYICGYSTKKISSLKLTAIKQSEMFNNDLQSRMIGKISRCHGCMIEGQCVGGCYIVEEFSDFDESARYYICTFYKKMFTELVGSAL